MKKAENYENIEKFAQVFIDKLGDEDIEVPEWAIILAEGGSELKEDTDKLLKTIENLERATDIWRAMDPDACSSEVLKGVTAVMGVKDFLKLPPGVDEMLDFYSESLIAIGDKLDLIEQTDPNGANEEFWLNSDPRDISLADGETPKPDQFLGIDWADKINRRYGYEVD